MANKSLESLDGFLGQDFQDFQDPHLIAKMDFYHIICNKLILFEQKPAKMAMKSFLQYSKFSDRSESTFKYLKVPERVAIEAKKWIFLPFERVYC